MRHLAAFPLVFSLALAVSLCAQTQEKPLTNGDVLDILNSGISEQVVIAKIKKSESNFDTSPAALKALSAAKVSDGVILAMIEATNSKGVSTNPETSTAIPARVNCSYPDPVPVFLSSSGVQSGSPFSVTCGDKITLLESVQNQSWLKMRTSDGEKSGYISSSILSVTQSDEPVKPNASTKEELLRAASDELEDCRVHAQNEYDTKMGVVSTLALTPIQRVYAQSKLKQNYDTETKSCRNQYEARLKVIEAK